MTTEELDKRIERLQREQAIISAGHDRLMEQITQSRTRYAQLTGAINELQSLKQSLNGGTPQ